MPPPPSATLLAGLPDTPDLPTTPCLQEYNHAAQHYTAALEHLDAAAGPPGMLQAGSEALRVMLLSNRSLALFRLGDYAAATEDAQAVLELQPGLSKAAFRAAAGQLALGDAASAVHRLRAMRCEAGAKPADMAAGWVALEVHAAARLAHEERRSASSGSSEKQQQQLQVLACQVAAELAAEADGEAGADADPVELLQQLTSLLGSGADQDAAAEAAAALEDPGRQCYQLLLFHLAGPSSSCVRAAAAALQAAAVAAGAGSPAVLWPTTVWLRLTAMAVDCCSGDSAAAAMQLLGWAAARDAWVRQHVLLHLLPGSPAGPAQESPVERILGLLEDTGRLHKAAPDAVVAAALLLQQYASDVASTEVVLHCRPLLPLLRAAAAAPGMAAFQPQGSEGGEACEEDGPGADGGSAELDGTASLSMEDMEQHALQQLRRKLQHVFIPELVAVRSCLLGAASALAGSSRHLVLAEAVEEKAAGSSADGKKTVVPGAFVTGKVPSCERAAAVCCGPPHAATLMV